MLQAICLGQNCVEGLVCNLLHSVSNVVQDALRCKQKYIAQVVSFCYDYCSANMSDVKHEYSYAGGHEFTYLFTVHTSMLYNVHT